MKSWSRLLFAATALTTAVVAGPTLAAGLDEPVSFQIAPGRLDEALIAYSRQADVQVIAASPAVAGKRTEGVDGVRAPREALAMLLRDSGLEFVATSPSTVTVTGEEGADGSGAGDNAVDALIVTAQKREEAIQDVPIAISAFTQKDLEAQKIEGGFDLVKAIPNVSFSKNNFSGYNFSIRGIGTKAVSVTTDPGVAVSFNSTTLIRNRLFEQEYFDLERVEVLRGPQGTLYGRNATSGVINVISAKPDIDEFGGSIKGEVGNYHAKRLVAVTNIPLVNEVLALRLAGALTQRDGYGVNLYDNSPADGRDLWSARATLGFQPSERIRANLIWERFEEDDDRQRTGKQLCAHDPGQEEIGGVVLQDGYGVVSTAHSRAIFSQGCLPGSLYDDAAFGTPNGLAIPFISALADQATGAIGFFPSTEPPLTYAKAIGFGIDPYGNTTQSRDLRAFYSQIKSKYQAKADILELNLDFDLTPQLTLVSQTAYNKDKIYATQDFNRYTTLPSFTDTANLVWGTSLDQQPSPFRALSPGGIFCDPQLGCSNTIVGQDLSRAKSEQFSQELRLQSAFDGPVNFNLGANYTRYRTVEDYYVFFNAITMAAVVSLNGSSVIGSTASDRVSTNPDCAGLYGGVCVPIEQNPIENIQDIGHNYFLSRNPYRLNSKSVFGEIYWDLAENLKLTAGLRFTDDEKTFTPIPSQTALTPSDRLPLPVQVLALPLFGTGAGYPAEPDIVMQWGEYTGRVGFDWKPELFFTDQTMLYAFYSRGYKGGGMNPPRAGLNYDVAESVGIIYAPSAPATFRPEFVNALEVGAKNTLMGGALILNTTAFYYDYKDYQVSKIVERTANNENFDAKVWGLELETLFQPTRNLRFNASLGYLDTELAEGSLSIDVMNRTAGRTDWVLAKPALTLMSNCIIPVEVVAKIVVDRPYPDYVAAACPGGSVFGYNYRGPGFFHGVTLPDGSTYDPADYPEANFGMGFFSDVSGNELPNSPHWTVTLGGQYSHEFGESWKATVRADFYWQSQQWARIYQLPIDKIHAWKNGNLSLLIERPDDGLAFELYAKNIFDDTPITDTFTNSDDTALTTNIFVLDPRLLGLSIKKAF